MDMPRPISINRVDSTRTNLRPEDGYDSISDDSMRNDFKDKLDQDQSLEKRIVYSRAELINIFDQMDSFHCPDWIEGNPNFPRRLDMKTNKDYFEREIFDSNITFKPVLKQTVVRPRNANIDLANDRKENFIGRKTDDERFTSDSHQSFDNGFRSNRAAVYENSNHNATANSKEYNLIKNLNHRNSNGFTGSAANYAQNTSSQSSSNHLKNHDSYAAHTNGKFNERQPQFGSNQRSTNDNRMVEDGRNDGRSFLRSRGPENSNQNFASFRRLPNRNQSDHQTNSYGSAYQHNHMNQNKNRNADPEWFTEGPISQHDTIELKGFDEDEENTDRQTSPQNNHDASSSNCSPPSKSLSRHNQSNVQTQAPKTDFDVNEFENINWQNLNVHQNADNVSIENQATSRFAQWFNDNPSQHRGKAPPGISAPVNANEDQINKLFLNARDQFGLMNQSTSNNNSNAIHQQQFNQQLQHQIDLQNDFFGNLMNRNNVLQQSLIKTQANQSQKPQQQQQHHQQQQQQQQQHHQQQQQQHHQQHQQQQQVDNLMNAVANQMKTDQQLFNILQKARINVNSLMQQNVLNKENVIKGQAKSAEELEANLLNSNSPRLVNDTNQVSANLQQQSQINNRRSQTPQHQIIEQSNDNAFQKLCDRFNSQTISGRGTINQDNSAINPFVLNLLDNAQKLNQTVPQQNALINQQNVNKNPQNIFKMFNNTNGQQRREERMNPFMPTSVIRKIAKEKSTMGASLTGGRVGLSEANFEAVTGNQLSERSILAHRAMQEEQLIAQQHKNALANMSMNQANLMQQNFAITTGNRWNVDEPTIQQHSIDSTTKTHHDLIAAAQLQQQEELRNILIRASKKSQQQIDPNLLFANKAHRTSNDQANSNVSQFPKVQNDNQKKLMEILQKASNNFGNAPIVDGNKINKWFEGELRRNNDHLSPIIKENAFTLEDIENN